MVEVSLKSESNRPAWFLSDDPQVSDAIRGRMGMRSNVWRPATDVYELEDAVVVRVEIAGMSDGNFSISLDGRFLTIRGTRPDVLEKRAYHQMEIPFGEFSTDVELAVPVNLDDVNAAYNDGFLKIVLQKIRPQQVPVKSENGEG